MYCGFIWKSKSFLFKETVLNNICKRNLLAKGEVIFKAQIIFLFHKARLSWGFCWCFQLLFFIIPCPFSFPDLQLYTAFRVTLTLSIAIKHDFANCSMKPGVNWVATIARCAKPLIFIYILISCFGAGGDFLTNTS